MSATQSHALLEAVLSEAEREISPEYSYSEEALTQQIPDLHGTEHLGIVTRNYQDCGAEVPIRETIPQGHVSLDWSDLVAQSTRHGKMHACLSASIGSDVVVSRGITRLNQVNRPMFGFPHPGRGMRFSSRGTEEDETTLRLNPERPVKILRTCRNRRLSSQRNGSL